MENEIDIDLQMMETACQIRGIVINAITMLERTIDTYLSHHFADTTEKRTELMQHVFATKFLTFEGKRHIFNKISSVHHKEFKDKDLIGIHAKLCYFNDQRNYLAHCVTNNNEDAIKRYINTKEITLLSYLHEIDEKIYSVESAKKIANEIYKFIEPITEIINFKVSE